jgi:hypothetical protein
MRAVLRPVISGTAIAALVAASVSCGDAVRQGRAPVFLVIDSIQAASGATPDDLGGFLLSDVQTLVEQTVNGQTMRLPTIYNDGGIATMRLVMKDQGTGGLGTQPSEVNAVQLQRYRIVFVRADGRNTPGIDVPFPVDGGVTATLTASPTAVSFEMVRHQAKLDQPLRSLVGFGGRVFISTLAEITFFGRDLNGNEVQATGSISVSFSDYGDPQ